MPEIWSFEGIWPTVLQRVAALLEVSLPQVSREQSLSVEEFMSLPELQQNPLVQRVIDIFDTDGNGEVDFKEFIEGVSQFSVKGDKEQKLRFAFRIYSLERRG